MRLLITGGTGFIGQHAVAALAGEHELALLRPDAAAERPLPPTIAPLRPHIDVVYADLRNFALTARAVRQARPDAVIHLAARGATDPFLPVESALRHNLYGTLNLLRACFERSEIPPRQLIIARTPGELSAMNVYAASKAAAWQFALMYARTHGWPVQGAMIFQAYGPGQPAVALVPAAARAALAGQDFPLTAGSQARDWIYVADVAGGLGRMLAAPAAPGETVELGTGEATAVVDVVRLIYELAGRGGQPLPGRLPDRPGEPVRQVADAAQTVDRLGWQTTTTLRDGLRQTLEALAG